MVLHKEVGMVAAVGVVGMTKVLLVVVLPAAGLLLGFREEVICLLVAGGVLRVAGSLAGKEVGVQCPLHGVAGA